MPARRPVATHRAVRRRPPSTSGFHPALRSWPGFVLDEAARRVRAAGESALRETGLRWNDVVFLTVLCKFPRGLSQAALADRSGLDRTTVSGIAVDLAYDGLITRRQHLFDGRQTLVAPAPHGQERLREARAALDEAERDTLRPLQARERRRLHQLALRVVPRRRHPLAPLFQ